MSESIASLLFYEMSTLDIDETLAKEVKQFQPKTSA